MAGEAYDVCCALGWLLGQVGAAIARGRLDDFDDWGSASVWAAAGSRHCAALSWSRLTWCSRCRCDRRCLAASAVLSAGSSIERERRLPGSDGWTAATNWPTAFPSVVLMSSARLLPPYGGQGGCMKDGRRSFSPPAPRGRTAKIPRPGFKRKVLYSTRRGLGSLVVSEKSGQDELM